MNLFLSIEVSNGDLFILLFKKKQVFAVLGDFIPEIP